MNPFPRGSSHSNKRKSLSKLDTNKKKPKQKKIESIHTDTKLLTEKHIEVGMLLLGNVTAIGDKSIVVGLPFLKTGILPASQISDIIYQLNKEDINLNDFFYVGQWIRVVVDSIQKKKKMLIKLSMRESVINKDITIDNIVPGNTVYGVIKSKEEHGYVVDFGINNVVGFLPHSSTQGWCPSPLKLVPPLQRTTHGGDQSSTKDTQHEETTEPEKAGGTLVMDLEEADNSPKALRRPLHVGSPQHVAQPLHVGQPLEFFVKEVKKSKERSTVTLSGIFHDVSRAQVIPSSITSIGNFQPGMLVKATISTYLLNGLLLNFCGYYSGTVHAVYLDKNGNRKTIQETYKKGNSVLARILFVNTTLREIGLTLKEAAISYRPMAWNLLPGEIIQGPLVVKRVDKGLGVLLELSDGLLAYATIHQISDTPLESLDEFRIGHVFPMARVIQFRQPEQLYSVTLKESDINMQFLTPDEVPVGQVVKCTIREIHPKVLIVSITKNISGIIPLTQMSELPVSNPSTRFKIGQTLTCRVLKKETVPKNLILTNKRTMVESDLPIISDLAICKPGLVTHGMIVRVSENHCLVKFYNDVFGFVPYAEMSRVFEEDARKVFRVGQVMKCRVLSCNPKKKFLSISFLIPLEDSENVNEVEYAEKIEQQRKKISLGQFVTGTITSIDQKGISVVIQTEQLPEKSEESEESEKSEKSEESEKSEKSKKNLIGPKGYIPVCHLSDFPAHCPLLLRHYSPGDVLHHLLVFTVEPKIQLTLKPALRTAATESGIIIFPQNDTELFKLNGKIIPGVISHVHKQTVTVTLGGVSVWVPVKDMASTFIDKAENFFQIGQTVLAKLKTVTRDLKEKTPRLVASLVVEDTVSVKLDKDGFSLVSYFSEQALLDVPTNQKTKNINWATYNPGAVITATVSDVQSVGVILSVVGEKILLAFAKTDHLPDAEVRVGGTFRCTVLNVDRSKAILDVSLRPDLVDPVPLPADHTPHHPLKVGTVIPARIELVHRDYLVLSIDPHYPLPGEPHTREARRRRLAYARPCTYNNALYLNTFDKWYPNTSVMAHVKVLPNTPEDRLIMALEMNPNSKENSDIIQLSPGMILKGKISEIYDVVMVVNIGPKQTVNLHVSEISDEIPSDPKGTQFDIFSKFRPGDTIEQLRIVSQNEVPENKYSKELQKEAKIYFEASLRPSVLDAPQNELPLRPTLDTIKKGEVYPAWVHSVMPTHLRVVLSPTLEGTILLPAISNDLDVLTQLSKKFIPRQCVMCCVDNINTLKPHLDLSLMDIHHDPKIAYTPSTISVSKLVLGRISSVKLNTCIQVDLFGGIRGIVFLTDIYDDYKPNPVADFVNQIGEVLLFYVLGLRYQTKNTFKTFFLSLRPSRVSPEKMKSPPKNPEIISENDLAKGMLIDGYVSHMSDKNCYVSISRNMYALVAISELSDNPVENPEINFPKGKLVRGRVSKIKEYNPGKKTIFMSLKKPP